MPHVPGPPGAAKLEKIEPVGKYKWYIYGILPAPTTYPEDML